MLGNCWEIAGEELKNWLLRRCACYGNRQLHDTYIPDDDDNDANGNDQDDDGDVKGHCCTAGRGVAGGAAGSQVLQLGADNASHQDDHDESHKDDREHDALHQDDHDVSHQDDRNHDAFDQDDH